MPPEERVVRRRYGWDERVQEIRGNYTHCVKGNMCSFLLKPFPLKKKLNRIDVHSAVPQDCFNILFCPLIIEERISSLCGFRFKFLFIFV